MKYFVIALWLFLIASCVAGPNDNVAVNNKFLSKIQPKGQNSGPFNFKDHSILLLEAFGKKIDKITLQQYDRHLQDILEKEFDGKKLDFTSFDSKMQVEFILRDSFKLTEQNIYCREYSQTVEYLGEIISHIGVSCRKDGRWQNLNMLTNK